MHASRRFIFGAASLLVGGVLLAGAIAIRQSIPDEYIGAQRAYLSELQNQLAEFDSLKDGPRIALIGSSPVIMGLSAERIESATGFPTRNLAMDASRATFQDYAALVALHIRPGDVAVIVNPNLRKAPQMQLPLACVTHFTRDCIRKQSGYRPRIVEDALVLFTNRAFGNEPSMRNPHGDFIFSEDPKIKTVPPKFAGPFPKNGAGDIAAVAMDVRKHGGCPIFAFTPLLPRTEEVALWQDAFAKLRAGIDAAGLHDLMVEDSPLWSDAALFHHDEHMTERGRKIWTDSIIAKLRDNGLPDSCREANARS